MSGRTGWVRLLAERLHQLHHERLRHVSEVRQPLNPAVVGAVRDVAAQPGRHAFQQRLVRGHAQRAGRVLRWAHTAPHHAQLRIRTLQRQSPTEGVQRCCCCCCWQRPASLFLLEAYLSILLLVRCYLVRVLGFMLSFRFKIYTCQILKPYFQPPARCPA